MRLRRFAFCPTKTINGKFLIEKVASNVPVTNKFIAHAAFSLLLVSGQLAITAHAVGLDSAEMDLQPQDNPVELKESSRQLLERYSEDSEALKRGKQIYQSGCGGYCHASYSQSQSDAPYLLDCYWKYGGEPEQIYNVIANGVKGTRMQPLLGQLKNGADDIWRVVAYLKSASECAEP